MPNHLLRFLLSGLLCLAVVGLSACGDSEEADENNIECTKDDHCAADEFCAVTQVCVPRDTCDGDVDCEDGEICQDSECVDGCRFATDCEGENICVDNSCQAPECSTDEECGERQECDRGLCEDLPLECEGVEVGGVVDCDPEAGADNIADGFLCGNFGGGAKCYFRCDQPSDDTSICRDDRVSSCAGGSFCASLSIGNNICFVSQCQHPGDLESCDDIEQASPEDFPHGANCLPYHAESRTFGCVAAGPLQEGDECGQDIDASCGEGLICGFDSVCKPVCNSNDDCSGNDRCIGDDTGRFLAGTGYGICGEGCDPFSRGQCDGGKGCLPVTPEDGLCLDSGTTPVYEACDGYIACDSASDCPNNEQCNDGRCLLDEPAQCEEGTQCVTLEEAEIGERGTGRCMPLCDTTSDSQAAMDATCPGGDAASFARFFHLAPGAGDLDVYIGNNLLIDNRSADTSFADVHDVGFSELPLGEVTIRVVDASDGHNGNPLARLTVDRSLNQQTTYAIVRQSNDPRDLAIAEIGVPRDVQSPAAGESSARVALDADLQEAVDVYLEEQGADLASASPIATDVSYGDVTGFTGALEPGDYELHLFSAGDDPDEDSPAYSMDVTLTVNTQVTLHVWGTPNDFGEFPSLSTVQVMYTQSAVTRAQGYCLDTGSSTGLCFERCTGPDGYGDGECSAAGDTCFPFRDAEHVCWPSEKIPEGQPCSPDAQNPCEEGSYCLEYGNGDSVCTSYCQPGGSDNDLLTCSGDANACESIGESDFDFGRCGIPCDPRDFPHDVTSPDCPAGLESCLAYKTDSNGKPLQAFCRTSGAVGVGQGCGDTTVDTCAAGGTCRREAAFPTCSRAPRRGTLTTTLFGPAGLLSDGSDGGVCREVCELFTDSCTSPDEACMVDATTFSSRVGFCMPKADELSDLGSLDPCPYELNGQMCGDGSVCTTLSGSSLCMQFCDRNTDAGCEAGLECNRLFSGDSIDLGYCTEPR